MNSGLNDYELVALAHENNEDAINLLYEKYKPIIVKKSNDAIFLANHHGVEINDIIQEGYIALDDAIKNFNQYENTTFYTFAVMCIDRRLANYVKKIKNKRSMLLNDAVAIDSITDKYLSDEVDIEKKMIDDYERVSKIEKLKLEMTNFESKVFSMRLDGHTFEEIANFLNKDVKAIYNAWSRIKMKYKKMNKF